MCSCGSLGAGRTYLVPLSLASSDYNGTIVEKYDVTVSSGQHKIDAECGNQGRNFEGLVKEGCC